MSKPRNKRRTPEEMAAHYAKLAEQYQEKAERQARGERIQGNSMVSRLKRALRTRETLLNRAQVTVNGKAATAKSPALPTIDEKIANVEKRLADYRETRSNALAQIAEFPQDIETLKALLASIDAGDVDPDDVEFPRDLHKAPGEGSTTSGEAETLASIDQEND